MRWQVGDTGNLNGFSENEMTLAQWRLVAVGLLIVSLVGLGICDLLAKDWKTAALGGLFAACNVLIFLVR